MYTLGDGNPIPALIDSTRPFIYLPTDIVHTIETKWGLQWVSGPHDGYYIVNDTQRIILDQRKPLLRFTLGQDSATTTQSGNGKTKTVSITLPYAALLQELNYPYVLNPTKFIPIRATSNTGAYVLGRTFLQEAYLTVDYERSKFSVAQALFPTETHVVSICALNDTTCITPSTKPGPPIATIAGVAAGAGAFLIILMLALFFLFRRSKLRKHREAEEAAMLAQKEKDLQSSFYPNIHSEKEFETVELDSGVVHESGGTPTYPMQEMPTPDTAGSTEMPDESTLSSYGGVYKLEDGGTGGNPIIKVFYEMDATPTSTPNETPTGTMSSGDTLVNSPGSALAALAPPNLTHLRQMDGGHQDDMSPIPQTPLEYYGGAAGNGPAGQRGWIGRAPGMPRVMLTPATPGSPTPEEVERSRWLRGHSGRGKTRRKDEN
jgi:hypothetical protein